MPVTLPRIAWALRLRLLVDAARGYEDSAVRATYAARFLRDLPLAFESWVTAVDVLLHDDRGHRRRHEWEDPGIPCNTSYRLCVACRVEYDLDAPEGSIPACPGSTRVDS